MPEGDLEGDEVYVTAAKFVPYVQYVAIAYEVVEAMYNFGRESETEKAIRLLNERVAQLEQAVANLDNRVSDLEVRADQSANLARLRTIREHLLNFTGLGVDLASHPEDAGDIAAKAMGRLRAVQEDDDLWLWSDIVRKPDDAPDTWRPAPAQFKGVPLPVFAIGTMLYAVAAHQAIKAGEPHATYVADAALLHSWVSTRHDWMPHEPAPVSIAERFRAAINIQIWNKTKYVTAEGYCEFGFVAVNDLERTVATIRDVKQYFGPSPNALCTTNPRIAAWDEAELEDATPQLKTLRTLEDAVGRIRYGGSLADPFIGQFPNWTAHRLTLYGVAPIGDLRRYQLEVTTALVAPPTVTPQGGVVGTGWQNFSDLLGTYDGVVYAFSDDYSVRWYHQHDVSRGPAGWGDPRTVRPERQFPNPGDDHKSYINGGGGTFYIDRSYVDRSYGQGFRYKRSLEFISHPDPSNGSGTFGDSTVVLADWARYATVFGGGQGVIYGIDSTGDLYWHRHTSWPNPGTRLEGPVRIGNGWNGFTDVFAFDAGFIAGVNPNGEMALYHFQQWRTGPGNGSPVWHGPVRVPGTHWRGFQTFIPSVGAKPTGVN
jgi:hypothetical protein